MSTVYVGDTSRRFAQYVKDLHPQAFLMNLANYRPLVSGEVVYTSISDLPFNKLLQLCVNADSVIYYPNNENAGHTEQVLDSLLVQGKSVTNYTVTDTTLKYRYLCDTRRVEDMQLWFSGCSLTFGEGVEVHERYCNLVGQDLNMPFSVLARRASGITWAADQILRSDIRKKDIVVWGLTSPHRVSYWKEAEHFLLPNYPRKWPTEQSRIYEEDLLAKNSQAIAQVQNFCKKIGAELILLGLLHIRHHTKQCMHIGNFIPFYDDYADFGSDGMHPGPAQHRLYADAVIQKIKDIT